MLMISHLDWVDQLLFRPNSYAHCAFEQPNTPNSAIILYGGKSRYYTKDQHKHLTCDKQSLMSMHMKTKVVQNDPRITHVYHVNQWNQWNQTDFQTLFYLAGNQLYDLYSH